MDGSFGAARKAPTHQATLNGETVVFHRDDYLATMEALVGKHPEAGAPKVVVLSDICAGEIDDDGPATARRPVAELSDDDDDGPVTERRPVLVPWVDSSPLAPSGSVESFSTFGALVMDDGAKARIDAQHAALRAAGIVVDASEQLFANGTRMASDGYATQAARKRDHERSLPLREAAAALCARIIAEGREDHTVTAGELARNLHVNGRVRAFGLQMSAHAVRGMLTRLDVPSVWGYVNVLRERIVTERDRGDKADRAMMDADRARMEDALIHELRRNPSVEIKLRKRQVAGDIFAAVSPTYAAADAPIVMEQILSEMMRRAPDARGSFSYDPSSTSWELRGEVWTPTPVAVQAVGEPFAGYVSFNSADNGGQSMEGGGGIELLRCLNASTYRAAAVGMTRRHTGAIVIDTAKMVGGAMRAIEVLCDAWGTARKATIETVAGLPDGTTLAGMPVSKALEGLWWGELASGSRSELAAVLPGRSKDHVKGLVQAYQSERRDPRDLVRADMAQGWTKYVQGQPDAVRRDAEGAIASWVVSPRPLRFVDKSAA